jgi:hypothetical protein
MPETRSPPCRIFAKMQNIMKLRLQHPDRIGSDVRHIDWSAAQWRGPCIFA